VAFLTAARGVEKDSAGFFITQKLQDVGHLPSRVLRGSKM
jgi:hypothetical protein